MQFRYIHRLRAVAMSPYAYLHSAGFSSLIAYLVSWSIKFQKSQFSFLFPSSIFPVQSSLNFLSFLTTTWARFCRRSVKTGETSIKRPMRRSSGYPRCDPSPPHQPSVPCTLQYTWFSQEGDIYLSPNEILARVVCGRLSRPHAKMIGYSFP